MVLISVRCRECEVCSPDVGATEHTDAANTDRNCLVLYRVLYMESAVKVARNVALTSVHLLFEKSILHLCYG